MHAFRSSLLTATALEILILKMGHTLFGHRKGVSANELNDYPKIEKFGYRVIEINYCTIISSTQPFLTFNRGPKRF